MGPGWKRLIIGVFVMISLSGPVYSDARIFSYMVGFMENTLTSEEDIELEVVTTNTRREPASLNITLHSGQIEEVVLEERSFRIHNIAAALLNIDSKKSFKGIRVDSNATISVVGVNRVKKDSQNSMDLFAGVEYSSLGAQYFAVTSYHSSEILIIGTTNNTRVTVALRTDSKYVVYEGTNYENADIINETVDEFNTIQIQSAGDLTGTKITATHPISVFSGNRWFGFESGSRKGSYLVEQLLPLEQWGTRYVAVPPEEFSYVFKIVACADDTEIYLTCAEANSDPLILKESGDFYMSDELNHACVITSSKQVLVAMITSHISDKDPSLIIAQPMETLLADVFLYVPTSFQSAELMLITTENQSLPILDPQPLRVEFFSIDEEFFGMRIRVSEGVSVLAAPQSYMHVSGYLHGTRYFGWGFESFGYPLLSNDFQHQPSTTDLTTSSPLTCSTKICLCYTSYTADQIADLIQELQKKLKVNKTQTSKYLRSKISASDDRTSSAAFGYVAVVILVTLGACVLAIDAGRLLCIANR